MSSVKVAVLTPSADLVDRLRKACPSYDFYQGQPTDDTRVVILDGQSATTSVPTRIHVLAAGERRLPGEVYVSREALLEKGEELLQLCSELAVTRDRAAALQEQAAFASQLQELMAISNFEKLSEQITLRALDLLGLPWGTLLIHDPQVERFVVSYSNDPDHK